MYLFKVLFSDNMRSNGVQAGNCPYFYLCQRSSSYKVGCRWGEGRGLVSTSGYVRLGLTPGTCAGIPKVSLLPTMFFFHNIFSTKRKIIIKLTHLHVLELEQKFAKHILIMNEAIFPVTH